MPYGDVYPDGVSRPYENLKKYGYVPGHVVVGREYWVVNRAVRRTVVTTLGGLVLLAGVVMLVLPGPGLLGMLLGFWILSLEYHWASRLVDRVRVHAHRAARESVKSRWRVSFAGVYVLGATALGVVCLLFPMLPLASTSVGVGILVSAVAVALTTGYALRHHSPTREVETATGGTSGVGPDSQGKTASPTP